MKFSEWMSKSSEAGVHIMKRMQAWLQLSASRFQILKLSIIAAEEALLKSEATSEAKKCLTDARSFTEMLLQSLQLFGEPDSEAYLSQESLEDLEDLRKRLEEHLEALQSEVQQKSLQSFGFEAVLEHSPSQASIACVESCRG